MSARAKGIACIVASAFGFALMAFFVRLCDDFGGAISCFQKSFFRNVVALAIAAGIFLRTRSPSGSGEQASSLSASQSSRIPRSARAWGLIALRSVFGTVGIFANFYALSRIPIGEAMTLNKTAPFFTVFFSWLVLGERVTRRQFAWLVFAFAGAALVMKPGFHATDGRAAAWALLGGLGAGLAYVCVHALGRLKVDGTSIVLAFSAFSCLASLPPTFLDFRPMTLAQVVILLGAGAGAAIGQFGVTAAYRHAEPRAIAAYDYTNVIFTSLLGFAFFGQVPDAVSVAGFAAILLSAFRLRR